jgi:hypothetical protein
MSNGLSVIIPSKSADNFAACYGAVREYQKDVQIILVDDGIDFSDETGLMQSMEITHIWTGKPFQFSRNCNAGIKEADIDDVVLLNDDALLRSPGGFTLLQKTAEENPEYGVIAAVTNNVGNQNQLPRNIGLREDPRQVCFIAVLIPRRTINLVGLLDERYDCYSHQDDDYCYRVRKAGLRIGIHDGCYVDHASLQSTFRGGVHYGGDLSIGTRIFTEIHGIRPELS